MASFVALLKAVNVGGHGTVSMPALTRVCGDLGFEDPRTILASGNVVFRYPSAASGGLEDKLEQALREELDLDTVVFVRSSTEWDDAVARNPFQDLATQDPGRLVLAVLKAEATARRWQDLALHNPGRERIQGARCHGYLYYPDGQGRSKLTTALIERILGTRATNRNWNTVVRISGALGL